MERVRKVSGEEERKKCAVKEGQKVRREGRKCVDMSRAGCGMDVILGSERASERTRE